MAMKGCSAFPKLQHHWNPTIRLFSVISNTPIGRGVLTLCRGAVGVFYSPSRLGNFPVGISSKVNLIPRLKFGHFLSILVCTYLPFCVFVCSYPSIYLSIYLCASYHWFLQYSSLNCLAGSRKNRSNVSELWRENSTQMLLILQTHLSFRMLLVCDFCLRVPDPIGINRDL